MRNRILLLFTFMLLSFASSASSVFNGTWQGRLRFMRFDIRLVYRLDSVDGKWKGEAQSPDQSRGNYPIDEVFIEGDSVYLELSEWESSFAGRFVADSNAIVGKITQRGFKLPLKLIKGEEDDLLYERPQRPRAPFPYKTEDVRVVNKTDKDTLAGTLTIPNGKGPFPAVVLISGSGLQDRDETIFGHKPFLLLADRLTQAGVMVLRCDDRGAGKSTGDPSTMTVDATARDVEAQVEFLRKRKDVVKKKIGLIGHSEGGIVAPMVAAKDSRIALMVLLAAPTIDFFDLLLAQDSLTAKAEGSKKKEVEKLVRTNTRLFEILKASKDSMDAQQQIVSYLVDSLNANDAQIEASIRQLCTPSMRRYVGLDPKTYLSQSRCPILAVYGEKDVQVPPAVNIPTLEELKNPPFSKAISLQTFPGLNHLFQPCKRCAVSEYVDITTTMDPDVLVAIETWVASHSGK